MTLRPHLRILVTPYCNLNCTFCKLGGEGPFKELEKNMTPEEIEAITRIGVDAGFRHVKITGGEALARPDIIEIVERLAGIKGIENLNLGTNGILVTKYCKDLSAAGLTSINISLNTLNDKLFKKMTKSKEKVSKILDGLKMCHEVGLDTTINTVIMRENKSEVFDILETGKKTGSVVKFMELNNLLNYDYWEKEYVPLTEIENMLMKRITKTGVKKPWDGIGVPMGEFILDDGTRVWSLNPRNGVFYVDYCRKKCINYPCADGIFALRITHNGYLRRCFFPIEEPDQSNVLDLLREKKVNIINDIISKYFNEFSAARIEHVWKPEIEKEKHDKYRI